MLSIFLPNCGITYVLELMLKYQSCDLLQDPVLSCFEGKKLSPNNVLNFFREAIASEICEICCDPVIKVVIVL